jgi:hypothetical protein
VPCDLAAKLPIRPINGILGRLRKGNRRTQHDFNQLLSSIKALSPEQARQLRQQLDRQSAKPKKPAALASGKAAKRAKPAQAKKPSSIDELHRKMMARGLIRRLPDPTLDIDDDDPDDAPVPIKGEPLSETILRERR